MLALIGPLMDGPVRPGCWPPTVRPVWRRAGLDEAGPGCSGLAIGRVGLGVRRWTRHQRPRPRLLFRGSLWAQHGGSNPPLRHVASLSAPPENAPLKVGERSGDRGLEPRTVAAGGS